MSKKGQKVKLLQMGTGWHVDCNGYNPYFEEQDSEGKKPVAPLSPFRAIQAMIALSEHQEGDNFEKDGGIDVIPGFHVILERYFTLQGRFKNGRDGPVMGRNLHRWGKYVTKFSSVNNDILPSYVHVGRIPDDWEIEKVKKYENINDFKKSDMKEYIATLKQELTHMKKIQKGDYIIWDNKTPHRNSDSNETSVIRKVMYHTLLPYNVAKTNEFIEEQRRRRDNKIHPTLFEKTWDKVEKDSQNVELNDLGKKVWGYERFPEGEEHKKKRKEKLQEVFKLEKKYLDFYKRYGFVVIPKLIDDESIEKLNRRVDSYIEEKTGILLKKLEETLTLEKWRKISGCFGGMLNVFYLKEMEEMRSREECYSAISQILSHTYASSKTPLFEHPLGEFDETNLCIFPDRINYRFPNSVLVKIANEKVSGVDKLGSKKRKGSSHDNNKRRKKQISDEESSVSSIDD